MGKAGEEKLALRHGLGHVLCLHHGVQAFLSHGLRSQHEGAAKASSTFTLQWWTANVSGCQMDTGELSSPYMFSFPARSLAGEN